MIRAFAQSRVVLIVILISVMLLSGCGDSSGSSSSTLAASFSVSASRSATAPFTVSFDASSSGGDIVSYHWDFGDSTDLISGKTTAHTFTDYGDFKVTLIVSNENFDTAQTTQNIVVGFSISGAVTAQPGSVVDSDTNDPLAPFASNDSAATAQLIPNPAIVGGFASKIGTGFLDDRFGAAGDTSDWYRVTLSVNQTITLSISDDPQENDLDLSLYTATNTVSPVVLSNSSNPIETVIVPADGVYYIKVSAFGGVSNYVLAIGNTSVLNTQNVLRVEDEFVPGDVIVKFRGDAMPQSGGLVSGVALSQSLASSLGLVVKDGQPGRAMLFSLGDEKQKSLAFSVLGIQASSNNINRQAAGKTADARQQLKSDTIKVVNALRQRIDVVSADLNYIRHPLTTPNDPDYTTQQWHYPLINLPDAWDEVTPVSSVVVAVVDTGLILSHPDLAGKLIAGYDFITSLTISLDGDGRDPNPDDPGDGGPDAGSSFHGTHVSGTIAALTNNNQGVAGVSWKTDTRVMPIRALGFGGGTSFDIMEGVRYAAGLSNAVETQAQTNARVAAGNVADIINLSVGGGPYSQFEQNIFTLVRNAGVIVVAAAGNDRSDVPGYPASYDGVISVSAVGPDVRASKQLASYSNSGSSIDIAAPGGDGGADGVFSTSGSGFNDEINNVDAREAGYRLLSGTSMASPHVAGVAALMKAVYPALQADAFDVLLQAGVITDDIKNDGASLRNDLFGFGLANALKAVQEAKKLQAGGALPAFLSVSPSAFNFQASDTSLTLTTSNPGGGNFIVSVEGSAPWVTVVPITTDSLTKLGSYSISVNRAGLADAQYQSTIMVTYSGDINGILNIPVAMQVGPLSTIGDTGFQYGLLVDFDALFTDSVEPIVSEMVFGSPVNGLYDFSFNGVRPGNYIILTTSDLDNDSTIFDPGEAFGQTSFVIQVIDQDVGGLNFGSKFDQGIGTLTTLLNKNPVSLLPLQRPASR
jgi:serine protease